MSQSWNRRVCISAFWLGLTGTVLGAVGLVTFNHACFQLYCVFVFFAVVAAVVGLRTHSGPAENRGAAWWGIGLPAVFFFLVLAFGAPLCGLILTAEVRTKTSLSLKRLTKALHDYHDEHGHLPPSAVVDAEGRPLLSWRVAILPFLGEELLYHEFKLDERWDSSHNSALVERMPSVFAAPPLPGVSWPPHATFFQGVVGPGTAFEPGKRLRLPDDFADGIAGTILLVEAGDPVPWTKPDDVAYDAKRALPSFGGILPKSRFPFASGEGRGFAVVLGNAEARWVHWLAAQDGEQKLRGAIVRNDGNSFKWDW
jgi:hypothetical protein